MARRKRGRPSPHPRVARYHRRGGRTAEGRRLEGRATMFDRSLVTSGFDTETLISDDYLTYVLLAQIEAGLFPLRFDVPHPDTGLPIHVQIHPPTDYERRYDPHPDAPPLPDAITNSLTVRLLPDGDEALLDLTAFVTVQDATSGQTVGPAAAGLLADVDIGGEPAGDFDREPR